MDIVQFGIKLKELRKARDVSQSELGDILGVSRATVGSWECGRRNITIKHLEALCEYFKLDMEYFTGTQAKDDMVDLLERARLLFLNKALPIEEKQKLSEELMRLYLYVKG